LSKILEQHEYNVQKGPFHEDVSFLPKAGIDSYPLRYIAYYLPQFHPIEVNDVAWGRGFTEWTNSTKALPRYVGHYQPRLPADLGFYSLENVDVIREQASLAKRGGIYGFCIHYYWFSGRKVLDKPLTILLENTDIDMPFFINWANESWTRTWDGSEQQVLLKQDYSDEDPLRFVQAAADIIQDKRYIRIDGRPLIMIYRPSVVPNVRKTVETWREFLIKVGLGNPYIIMPQAFGDEDPRRYGLDAAAGFPPHNVGFALESDRWKIKTFDPDFVGTAVSYDKMVRQAIANRPTGFKYFPGVCPSWDNEARRPKRGFSFYGSTPQKYGDWLRTASEQALSAPSADERIVFINAWNEWAEGTYLEPDRHFGFAYLAETRRALEQFRQGGIDQKPTDQNLERQKMNVSDKFMTSPMFHNQLQSFIFALRRRIRKKRKGSR
jgi:lipopolysaccharide biosynthesis protein